jgi:hypothetical protein
MDWVDELIELRQTSEEYLGNLQETLDSIEELERAG